ncbi:MULTISPECIES: acetyltransferase [unclassified Viridibacillus]|uniref:acetyltransferase n=1 Tax=unclassified Viridibacillus TaxID=2617942 RepID=UPI00096E8F23|nr:acetyltransferase [Viridibacillus sp. FSL H8-0123]OMC81688.1 sugar acetyltransferase [Viridibacillus sp. FSL H8-0123]
MNKSIIIIGNGGHASVLTEILLLQQRNIIGFTAPKAEVNSYGLKYLGTDEIIKNYNPEKVELVLGLGTVQISTLRQSLFEKMKKLRYTFVTCVHPNVIISTTAILAEGSQVMAGAIIQPHARIGENTIINTGVIIEHDCVIGAHVHIAPGTTLSGSVHIGEGSHIGTGSSIIQAIEVGKNALIGAGAVVISNIGTNKKVFGVPAKEV